MKTQASACNIVADDLIWKDHIKKEFTASDQWQTKWGFLASVMEKQNQEISSAKRRDKKQEISLPMIDTSSNKPFKNSKPFPQTTTQFIGWKSQYPENRLDKYGQYTKPLKSFLVEYH